jgi:Domain of unknown function DUF29
MARISKATSVEMSGSELYERDYYAWIQNQVRALREHCIEESDWTNVAEEIEDLGKSEKCSVESNRARIVEHLLKLAYAPARVKSLNRRGGEITVREACREIRRSSTESPSCRRKTPEVFPHAYQGGRNAVLIRTNLPEAAVPEISPWSLEQVSTRIFFPTAAQTPDI